MRLVVIAVLVIAASASPAPPPHDVIEGEDYEHVRPPHDERFNGHLAHYITLSKLTFSNLRMAKAALYDITSGTRTFLDYAKELSIDNAKTGRHNPALQNGDLGLLTYELLEEELAEVAFDIRNPLTKSAGDILGPICSPSGCSLMAVFSRFRKSFFSDAWWEADQYCREHDIQFSELLQRLGTDSMSMVASVIWPDEHVVFKKLKLRQLKSDLGRLNEVDPSTVLNSPFVAPSNRDMGSHHKLMKRRERIFATMDQQTLGEHTEIYAMSVEQMVKRELVPQELVDTVDAALAEEELRAEQLANDALKEFESVGGTKVLKRKSNVMADNVPSAQCGGAAGGESACDRPTGAAVESGEEGGSW